jgi:hypothetical protein
MWHIQRMGYYSAIEKKGILSFAATWIGGIPSDVL